MARVFTQDELDMVREMSQDGKTQDEIAEVLGVNKSAFVRNKKLREAWKSVPCNPALTFNGKGKEPVKITEEQIKYIAGLAQIHCTMDEIAAFVGCSVDTLQRRPEVMKAINEGKMNGKASIRRMQYQAAKNGNTTMLIWLGKNVLGQRDNDDGGAGNLSPDELRQEIRRDVKKMFDSLPEPPKKEDDNV